MTDRLFFYGTLMSGQLRGHVLEGLADPVGEAAIRGYLYNVGAGAFPAYLPGDGIVHGEVWQVREGCLPHALYRTDGIEGYRPDNPAWSMYHRVTVPLLDGSGDVQTYRWNGPPPGPRIASGSWREAAGAAWAHELGAA